MTSIRRSGRAAGLALTVGLFVAACGSSSKTTTATTTRPTTTVKAATVALRTVPPFGSIAVDATGRTLYRFDKDTAGSGTSACSGNCALTWAPAQVSGTPTAGAGVTGTLGVITRSDGIQQVTLDGRPLYLYSGDQAAGDTKGDGTGGVWHVATIGAITTPPASAATVPATTIAPTPATIAPTPTTKAATPTTRAATTTTRATTPTTYGYYP